ncbi:hypothetical protein [Candidatus Poriferisodalis sp.]|uniref:hypothetical protein n=1 Tax=Candidatus Poriferisodalis sp. TaxID=3101277 RepID=UPI003B0235A0
MATALAVSLLVSACGLLSDDNDDSTDATTTTAADGSAASSVETATVTTTLVTVAPTTTSADAPADGDSGPAASNVTTASKLSTAGLSPVQIGHTLQDAQTAAGALLIAVPGGTDACRYYTIQNGPQGVRLLAVNAEIVRVDIDAGPITTISGYGIGSTRSEIVEAFGNRIEDGPGLSAIQYVPVDTPDADKRVVWEIDEAGSVISLRAGRLPHITPRVGCTS